MLWLHFCSFCPLEICCWKPVTADDLRGCLEVQQLSMPHNPTHSHSSVHGSVCSLSPFSQFAQLVRDTSIFSISLLCSCCKAIPLSVFFQRLWSSSYSCICTVNVALCCCKDIYAYVCFTLLDSLQRQTEMWNHSRIAGQPLLHISCPKG